MNKLTLDPWILGALVALGLALGAGGAWWVQGLRLEALQAKYDGFVSTTKATGEAAKIVADAKEKADKDLKDQSDAVYKTTIAGLTADVKRLRDARAGSSFVPQAPAGSRSLNLACFDRTQLEQAIREFDFEIQRLVDQGSADAVGLNVARAWARGMPSAAIPNSQANTPP